MKINRAALTALCLLATPACADPISGLVHPNGKVAYHSSLYTVTHVGPGHYVINFANPMVPAANCIVMPFRSEASFVAKIVVTETSCDLVTKNIFSGRKGADTSFTFIAVPMSN